MPAASRDDRAGRGDEGRRTSRRGAARGAAAALRRRRGSGGGSEALPRLGGQPLERASRPGAAARPRAQRRVGRHGALERGGLGGVELAEQICGRVAHHSPSSAARRRRSPLTIRDFTVPSGRPVAAAISVWLWPR